MAETTNTNPPEEYRFKPGQSGNPKGLRKGTIHIKTLAKQIFEDMDTWERLPVKDKNQIKQLREMVGSDKSYGQALLYAWIQKALQDPRFATIVLELMDGKGKVEHGIDPDLFDLNEFTIKVVKSDNTDTDTERETGDSSESTK